MGMSTHVVGIVEPDDRYRKLVDIWHACVQAGVAVPAEVDAYFNGEEPDPAGFSIHFKYDQPIAREWRADSSEGYEIDVADIPSHVKTVRFYNSW